MVTCPEGHRSESEDYCDTCGLPVDGGRAPDGTAGGAGWSVGHRETGAAGHSLPSVRPAYELPAVESASAALERGSEPGLINELITGGAVAASFTAAASVAKARIEATTQRRKNELDAEVRREQIASQERQAVAHERGETTRARLGGGGTPPPVTPTDT
ncbi:hypothetical protein K7472_27365 [Streptomyces sp. PTM05]|uniref:Uncharacterized protein n=1 Tax=Streptantibioticus parmotrematis TaxID=2873249 RepID=A0ABS7QZ90_9ACTN|nr:hypothetical protein [Streptantibioticus parmotrematis]MBY8888533.1 hypothetical protein [Streptantibioticus parmotrematis]